MSSYTLEKHVAHISGQVVANESPGLTLKTWRMRLQIKQITLSKEMGIAPSVLSDYESGRRVSPGVAFIRRYVETLVSLDMKNKNILNKHDDLEKNSAIISIGEFKKPITAKDLSHLLKCEVLQGSDYLNYSIYGYTFLDSIKTIYTLSGLDFYRIFGATTERVLIFTKVGIGRSPLVAIRVSQLKPRMVVLHGLQTVDPMAIKLAEREKIVLSRSNLSNEDSFKKILNTI